MAGCCDEKSGELEQMSKGQTKVLWTVLSINLVMFVVELTAGVLGNSVALTGDSLDMLGDAVAYGSSLYVVSMGSRAKAWSAMLKGTIMLISAIAVLSRAIYKTFNPEVPELSIMATIGIIVLVANLVCLMLLTRHKDDDVNMSSVWICSRNDIIANLSVLAAAILVYFSESVWPDLIVGLGITILFTKSAFTVFSRSKAELG